MCSENLYVFSPLKISEISLQSSFNNFLPFIFYIHLIKAELNSCDIQANKVLNFCKCFLSEKRWKKRQSSNILKQNSTTHCWHGELWGYGLSLEHCCLYKSINSFRAKHFLSHLCICCRPALGLGMYVCSYVCMYIGMVVFRYAVPKMKMCINMCWDNLKTDFKMICLILKMCSLI